MRYLRLPLFAVLAVATIIAVSSRGEAHSGGLIAGEHVAFDVSPSWTNSGAWDKDGNLLLVDVLAGKVRRYNSEGQSLTPVDDVGVKPKGHTEPTLIQNGGAGSVWIEYEDAHLVKLNSQLRVESRLPLLEVNGDQGKLTALFWWIPLNDSELLAFADIQRGKEVTGAVLRIPIAAPGNFKVLQAVPTDSPAHRFFLIGQSFLAAVKGKPYFLIMGPTPYVVRPDGSRFKFVQVTKSGRVPLRRPDLPARVTMDTTADLFQRLERTAAPAGLYGSGEFLYVLLRTPVEERTTWNLMKIKPLTGEILWNRRLDSSANHMVVVPGEKHWAFVEKGPVKGPGRQAVPFFMLVPTSTIEE